MEESTDVQVSEYSSKARRGINFCHPTVKYSVSCILLADVLVQCLRVMSMSQDFHVLECPAKHDAVAIHEKWPTIYEISRRK